MTDHLAAVTDLARSLVSLDSRSFVSNLAVADRVEAALGGFEIERLDYTDEAGVAKRALVATRAGARRDGVLRRTWTPCPIPAGRTIPGRPGSARTACCTGWAAPT